MVAWAASIERYTIIQFSGKSKLPKNLEKVPLVGLEPSPTMPAAFGVDLLVSAEFAARFVLRHQPHPTSVKNTAKKASMTITAKMPVTTAMVVRRPTSSEFPFTCMP